MGKLEYLKNVVTLELDEEKCVGCGMCIQVCPHAILGMNGIGHAEIQNRDGCMECGACMQNCPTEALTVESGVGCATAIINAMFGRDSTLCSCTIDTKDKTGPGLKTRCC